MRLNNEITDRCLKYYGDILKVRNRKDMRAIITNQNRREREAEYESKQKQKEEARLLRQIKKDLEQMG